MIQRVLRLVLSLGCLLPLVCSGWHGVGLFGLKKNIKKWLTNNIIVVCIYDV